MNTILSGLLISACLALTTAYPAELAPQASSLREAPETTLEETLQPEESRYRQGWGGYYGGYGHQGGWGYGGGWNRGRGWGYGPGYGGYGGGIGVGYGVGYGAVGLGYGGGWGGGLIY